MATLLLLNKPFHVLCQFTDAEARVTLAKFVHRPDFYAAGRLDYDSEGLVLLTNDGLLQNRIADPAHKLPKTYWIQVEGIPDSEALARLGNGVNLKDGWTKPAQVKMIEPPELWLRVPPVRTRLTIPCSWLELTITEGRNRQVRRMSAAVGHPTLRLVRIAVGPWSIDGLAPGQTREVDVHLPNVAPSRHSKAAAKKISSKPVNRGRR